MSGVHNSIAEQRHSIRYGYGFVHTAAHSVVPHKLANPALKHYQETTKDLVAVSSISAQIRDAEARLENVNKTLAVVESRLARINAMA